MSNEQIIMDSLNVKNDYRDKLELSPFTKFGLEIEMDHVSKRNRNKIIEEYDNKNGYYVSDDKSLHNGGIELDTRVFSNKEKSFVELMELSDRLKKVRPQFDRCSLQVNLDCHMNFNEVMSFLQFYAYYEDIILRISRGNDRVLRYTADIYAIPILKELRNYIKYCKDEIAIIEKFMNSKIHGVALKDNIGKENYKSGINVIEFRSPNGTIDPILWQNYIMVFQSMIDFIESNDWLGYHFDVYNEVPQKEFDINRAIEFANIVFVSEKEKLIFLKQYIGNRKLPVMLLNKKRN